MDLEQLSPEERNVRIGTALDAATRGLEPLVVESRQVQERVLAFREHYDQQGPDTPLAPRMLHEIRKGTRRYLDLQQALAGVAVRTERLATATAADMNRLAVEPELKQRGVITALAASTTLYDNYLAMLPLLGDRRFRRLVNQPDLGYGIGR